MTANKNLIFGIIFGINITYLGHNLYFSSPTIVFVTVTIFSDLSCYCSTAALHELDWRNVGNIHINAADKS